MLEEICQWVNSLDIVVDNVMSFLEHVNIERDSYYYDYDDLKEVLWQRNSKPSRTSV